MNLRMICSQGRDETEYLILKPYDFDSPGDLHAVLPQEYLTVEEAFQRAQAKTDHQFKKKPKKFSFSDVDILRSGGEDDRPIRSIASNKKNYYTQKNFPLPAHIQTVLSQAKEKESINESSPNLPEDNNPQKSPDQSPNYETPLLAPKHKSPSVFQTLLNKWNLNFLFFNSNAAPAIQKSNMREKLNNTRSTI